MSDERLRSDRAIRNPKKRAGRAHRAVEVTSAVFGDTWVQTACGRGIRDMTEVVPAEQAAPDDRCTQCWPRSE